MGPKWNRYNSPYFSCYVQLKALDVMYKTKIRNCPLERKRLTGQGYWKLRNDTAVISLSFFFLSHISWTRYQRSWQPRMPNDADKNSPPKVCSLQPKDQERGNGARQKKFNYCPTPAKHHRKKKKNCGPHPHSHQRRLSGEPRFPSLPADNEAPLPQYQLRLCRDLEFLPPTQKPFCLPTWVMSEAKQGTWH